jgi:hypothetical protein
MDKWVELKLNGSWVDITDRVRGNGKITISRGKANEQSAFTPNRCTFNINNANGDFSDINQNGPYFGLIGPNTEMRVLTQRVRDTFTRTVANGMGTTDSGQTYTITGTAANFDITGSAFTLVTSTTAQAATLGLFGDVEIRASMTASADTFMGLTKRMANGDRITAYIDTAGNGINVSRITGGSTYFPLTPYTSQTDTTLTTGVSYTMILSISEIIKVKVWLTADPEPDDYQISFWADMTEGTTEDLMAPRNLDIQQGAVGMFAQAGAGSQTVTFDNFSAREIRFHGEIAAWPPEWDNTGRDAIVRIEANGPSRRLNVRNSPVYSPMRRSILGTIYEPLTASYFPLENDGVGGARYRNAIKDAPDAFMIGIMNPGQYSGFPGSDPIHVAAQDRSGFTSTVVNSKVDMNENINFQCLMFIPEAGLPVTTEIVNIAINSSITDHWVIIYSNTNGGELKVRGIDSEYGVLVDTGLTQFGDTGVNGRQFSLFLGIQDDGAIGYNIILRVAFIDENGDYTQHGTVDNVPSGFGGKPVEMTVKTDTGGAIGHLEIGTWDSNTVATSNPQITFFSTPYHRGIAAYQGEASVARFLRLCAEEGVWGQALTDYDTLTPICNDMGPQPRASFMSLIQDVETAEHGLLYEARDTVGYSLRTAYALWNREPVAEYDYSLKHFSGSMRPTNDDLFFKNSITVGRPSGQRSQPYQVETGRKSVDLIGEWRGDYTFNYYPPSDDGNQAQWHLRILSWDEQRIPNAQFELHRDPFTASAALSLSTSMLATGRVLQISNGPIWLQQGTITELVVGETEVIDNLTRTITANTVPYGPHKVAVFEAVDVSVGFRLGWDDAKLSGAHNASTTTLSVEKTTGAFTLGAEPDSHLPFYVIVDSEVMSVTNVTGTGPFSFTVTRAQRGTVAKTHADDAAVLPYDFPVIGLAKKLN